MPGGLYATVSCKPSSTYLLRIKGETKERPSPSNDGLGTKPVRLW